MTAKKPVNRNSRTRAQMSINSWQPIRGQRVVTLKPSDILSERSAHVITLIWRHCANASFFSTEIHEVTLLSIMWNIHTVNQHNAKHYGQNHGVLMSSFPETDSLQWPALFVLWGQKQLNSHKDKNKYLPLVVCVMMTHEDRPQDHSDTTNTRLQESC